MINRRLRIIVLIVFLAVEFMTPFNYVLETFAEEPSLVETNSGGGDSEQSIPDKKTGDLDVEDTQSEIGEGSGDDGQEVIEKTGIETEVTESEEKSWQEDISASEEDETKDDTENEIYDEEEEGINIETGYEELLEDNNETGDSKLEGEGQDVGQEFEDDKGDENLELVIQEESEIEADEKEDGTDYSRNLEIEDSESTGEQEESGTGSIGRKEGSVNPIKTAEGKEDCDREDGQEIEEMYQCLIPTIGEDPSLLEIVEEILNEEEIKYNEEEIIGSATYNGVTVNVASPIGSFPEGTILKIIPIESKEKNEEIERLIEKNVIVSVSFDISFLDKKTGLELSPLSGKNVEVVFNYENNKDLFGVSESDMIVYHVDDKIEEGGELTAKEVEIISNKGGMLKIEADSFSTYTLLGASANYVVTFDPQGGVIDEYSVSGSAGTRVNVSHIPDKVGYMFDGWYTDDSCTAANPSGCVNERGGVINSNLTVHARWLPFEDLVVTVKKGQTVTMMDRNLGATEAWIDTTKSAPKTTYGKFYQRGNNFGFDSILSESEFKNKYTVLTNAINVDNVVGGSYYSNIYISKNNLYSNYSRNMWGGSGNEIDRQGPCPIGYHIPSRSEWSTIVNILGTNIKKLAHLPSAGYRTASSSSAGLSSQGSIGRYATTEGFLSSNNMKHYVLDFDSSRALVQSYDASRASSIRCFKNAVSYVELSFNSKGGSSVSSLIVGTNESLSNEPIPTRSNSQFDGWYTIEGNRFTFSSSTFIEKNTTLYARWICNSGYESNNDGTECIESSYNVSFEDGDGHVIYEQSVIKGGKVIRPEDPTKDGYTFLGWYILGTDTLWNFGTDTVTGNMILYAKRQINEPVSMIIPNLIEFPSVSVERSDKIIDVQIDEYFGVKDPVGSESGWYITIEATSLSGNISIIDKGNIYLRAGNLETVGDTNDAVHIDQGMLDDYVSLGTAKCYIYREESSNHITGTYRDKPTLRVAIPAYQPVDTYAGKLIVTLYEGQ